jgi:hypothetical protein
MQHARNTMFDRCSVARQAACCRATPSATAGSGVRPPTINGTATALRFFLSVTVDRVGTSSTLCTAWLSWAR